MNGVISPLIGPVGLRPIEAHAVSADGSVVIGEALSPSSPPAADHLEAFRWSNGVATGLGRLSNTDYSRAFGVSADGSVVVGDSASFSGSGRSEAFRWVNGVMTALGSTPGNIGSVATAVSADGRVVVGAAFGPAGFPAFRWENGVMGSIGDLGSSAYAQAVSGDGSVIVGWAGLPGGASETVAFIWDAAHGMRNLQDVLRTDYGLDPAGWQLLQATGISDDGRTIVGYGHGPDDNLQAFRVTLPEPAAMSLFAPAAAMLLRRRRR